jgi:peptidyl-prolyl cis-trans isomerase B (cyclophilin B)
MDQATPSTVVLDTSEGTITIELDAAKAPDSARNVVDYVKSGHYDGTVFHRVIPGFMVQGGGFEPGMKQKPTSAPIRNEAGNGLKNKTGTVAMARTAEIDSATAQFFINTADNKFLDHGGSRPEVFGYAVFGRVVDGMDVVYTIEQVAIGTRGGNQDLPVDPVVINTVTVID